MEYLIEFYRLTVGLLGKVVYAGAIVMSVLMLSQAIGDWRK